MELLAHLRARLRNSTLFYTMKLMIVGLASRGKMTLMHRIRGDYKFNKTSFGSKSLKSIRSQIWNELPNEIIQK